MAGIGDSDKNEVFLPSTSANVGTAASGDPPFGTKVILQGKILAESGKSLVMSLNWRGRCFTGSLLKAEENPWAPDDLVDKNKVPKRRKIKKFWKRKNAYTIYPKIRTPKQTPSRTSSGFTEKRYPKCFISEQNIVENELRYGRRKRVSPKPSNSKENFLDSQLSSGANSCEAKSPIADSNSCDSKCEETGLINFLSQTPLPPPLSPRASLSPPPLSPPASLSPPPPQAPASLSPAPSQVPPTPSPPSLSAVQGLFVPVVSMERIDEINLISTSPFVKAKQRERKPVRCSCCKFEAPARNAHLRKIDGNSRTQKAKQNKLSRNAEEEKMDVNLKKQKSSKLKDQEQEICVIHEKKNKPVRNVQEHQMDASSKKQNKLALNVSEHEMDVSSRKQNKQAKLDRSDATQCPVKLRKARKAAINCVAKVRNDLSNLSLSEGDSA